MGRLGICQVSQYPAPTPITRAAMQMSVARCVSDSCSYARGTPRGSIQRPRLPPALPAQHRRGVDQHGPIRWTGSGSMIAESAGGDTDSRLGGRGLVIACCRHLCVPLAGAASGSGR